MKSLTILEAERLSIYFEESGAYQHKQNKQIEAQSRAPSAANERTVLEIGDDEDEDEE